MQQAEQIQKEMYAGHTKNVKLTETVKREILRNKYLYLIAIPVIAYYLLFCYLPMFGLVIAFKDYNLAKGIWESPWVGFTYFREFFSGIYFTRTLYNTLAISVGSLIFGFPVPIIFALMLNELKSKWFGKLVQTATYLPHFISMVVICGMIVDFFSTDGVISVLISKFGGENMNYIGNPAYFRAIFIGTSIWQDFGWNSIIYIAALAGIDQEPYEAATVDGAGRFKKIWHITLPGIAPTIMVLLILNMGGLLTVGFEKVMLLYSPATYEVADVISTYVYRMGIENSRYGFSAAVGIFQSLVNVILVLTANVLSKKMTETALF